VGFVNLNNNDLHLAAGSPALGHATDGKNIGVDFVALDGAQNGVQIVIKPTPTPTPSPTLTPTPTPSPTSTPTPLPTPTPQPISQIQYRIAAGGNPVTASGGNFVSDIAFASSQTISSPSYTVTNSIDLSGVKNPAPMALYQGQRYGEMAYTFPKLTPGTSYLVRLHFSELYFDGGGKRLFDVLVNNQTMLHEFDTFAAAGGKLRAVIKEFTVKANTDGTIVLNFHYGSQNHPAVSGVEVIPANIAVDINDPATFVTQQYRDFFGRDPDANGLQFWTVTLNNQLATCATQTDSTMRSKCETSARAQVSAAFFLSTEFQHTGYLLVRYYTAIYGRVPSYQEFMTDHAKLAANVVVGQTGWESILAANNERFIAELLARSDVTGKIRNLSNSDYVTLLMKQAGVQDSEESDLRFALAKGLGAGSESRASVLERVADCPSVYNRQYNPAFVLMQYFGYLRRDPQAAPDTNIDGFNFWVAKLNANSTTGVDLETSSDGLRRVTRAQMVEAFITSSEYLSRFK
jgi:hypothetical protein